MHEHPSTENPEWDCKAAQHVDGVLEHQGFENKRETDGNAI